MHHDTCWPRTKVTTQYKSLQATILTSLLAETTLLHPIARPLVISHPFHTHIRLNIKTLDIAEMTDEERSSTLNELYSQLRDIDRLKDRLSDQRVAAGRRRWGPGNDHESEEKIFNEQWVNLISVESLVDDLQSTIRKTINTMSRPTLRPLRILDLPDEILMKISECAHAWPHRLFMWHKAEGYKDIQSLRLTCRRFCKASSHLLLHFLRVDLDSSSLAHFEEISRHPAIRVGMRCAKVVLHYYNPEFADNILDFTDFYLRKLGERIESLEHWLSEDIPDFPTDKEVVKGKLKQAKRMLRVWEREALNIPDNTFNRKDLRLRQLLREAHHEYQRRFTDQERLLQDRAFVHSLATAIARMPNMKRLEIVDWDRFSLFDAPSFFSRGNGWDALMNDMVQPFSWEKASLYSSSQPPMGVLTTLPWAIHEAGGLITDISIELSPREHFGCFGLLEADVQNIRCAAQRLQRFSFYLNHDDSDSWRSRDFVEIDKFCRFLMAFLDSASVEEITINLRALSSEQDTASASLLTLGQILTLRSWPSLSYINLGAIPIDFNNLEQFVNQLCSPAVYVSMNYIHLLSGTWGAALDLMRKINPEDWSLDCPTGAECDMMSDEEKQAVFGTYDRRHWEKSKAEMYIMKWIDKNPLRGDTGEMGEVVQGIVVDEVEDEE